MLLDADAVDVLIARLHQALERLFLLQIAALALGFSQRLLQRLYCFLEAQDFAAVKLFLIHQLFLELFDKVLVMLGIFINKVLFPEPNLLLFFAEFPLELLILSL